MNILTDILSLIRRGVFVKTASPNDVIVLGVNEQPDMTGVASWRFMGSNCKWWRCSSNCISSIIMENIKKTSWIKGLLQDERGVPSSKRFVGIIAGLILSFTLIVNQFTDKLTDPSPVLVNAVAMLAFGCLGLASVDKIWGKRN